MQTRQLVNSPLLVQVIEAAQALGVLLSEEDGVAAGCDAFLRKVPAAKGKFMVEVSEYDEVEMKSSPEEDNAREEQEKGEETNQSFTDSVSDEEDFRERNFYHQIIFNIFFKQKKINM